MTKRTSAMNTPKYNERWGWIGGDTRTLYAFTDKRTGDVTVAPLSGARGIGPECVVSIATRAQAEEHWQSPLHPGWTVAE